VRYILLDDNKKVIGIRDGINAVEGEIQSDIGDLGQIMQLDGTFITPEPELVEPIETLEQKIERLEQQIQQDNLITFEVLATIYEELLMKGSV
jgi:hypothetical protein